MLSLAAQKYQEMTQKLLDMGDEWQETEEGNKHLVDHLGIVLAGKAAPE